MLVARLLPGQMAQLLRWVHFLERCDCTAKGSIKQRTEVLTAVNSFTWAPRDCRTQKVCEHVCPVYIVWRPPIWRIKLKSIAVSWVILFGSKGCKVHNTTQSLSNGKFLFWKYPLSGSDTTAMSPSSTPQCGGHTADVHPLISLSVFHSQSWVITPKAGRQITFKAEVAKFSWGGSGCGGHGNGHRLSCDTLVTKIDEWVWCQKVTQIGLRAPSLTAQRGYIFYIQRKNIPSWEI